VRKIRRAGKNRQYRNPAGDRRVFYASGVFAASRYELKPRLASALVYFEHADGAGVAAGCFTHSTRLIMSSALHA